MSGLSEEGPIVIINIHSDHCDALALIAGAKEPLHISLSNFSYQEAEHLANSLHTCLLSFGIRSRLGIPLANEGSLYPTVNLDFPAVLKVLWSNVVSPILEALAFSVRLTVLFIHILSQYFLSRSLILMQNCPTYGGAQLALSPFFQFMQQAFMSMAKAFLGNTYQNLPSHHTSQL